MKVSRYCYRCLIDGIKLVKVRTYLDRNLLVCVECAVELEKAGALKK